MDPLGFHARPVAYLAKTARGWEQDHGSTVKISFQGQTVKASSLMKVMALGVRCNDTVVFSVEGGDEDATAAELKKLLDEWLPVEYI